MTTPDPLLAALLAAAQAQPPPPRRPWPRRIGSAVATLAALVSGYLLVTALQVEPSTPAAPDAPTPRQRVDSAARTVGGAVRSAVERAALPRPTVRAAAPAEAKPPKVVPARSVVEQPVLGKSTAPEAIIEQPKYGRDTAPIVVQAAPPVIEYGKSTAPDAPKIGKETRP